MKRLTVFGTSAAREEYIIAVGEDSYDRTKQILYLGNDEDHLEVIENDGDIDRLSGIAFTSVRYLAGVGPETRVTINQRLKVVL